MFTVLYTIPFAIKETPHSAHNLHLYVLCDSSTKGDCDPKRHEPLSGIEVYTMNAQPSPPGSHRSYRYGHK
jgi:acyl-CoA-binding protein